MSNQFVGYVWYNPPHDEGRKVGVNWYRNGQLGVSFLTATGQRGDEAKVLNEDEVEFRYGTLESQEEKKDVREESYEELKARLERIRKERRNYGRRRKSTKKKKKKKKPKKEKDPMSALKNVDPDLIKQVLEESGE